MYNLESKVQKSFANNEKNFIVDNNCVVVCPWVIRSGFQNISESGFLHSAADPYWFGFFQKIFTGNQVITATWEDSTYLTKINNKYEFQYNFQTGKFYQGAVVVGSAESGTEIEPVEGNEDFLAMKNNSSVTIRFEDWVPSEEDMYKLYTIPDLYGNKWYYISNVKFLNDLQSTLGNDEEETITFNETSIPVVEVTFTSLVDKLQVSGKAVEQYVQYAGIGEPYVVPLVTQYNANDLEEDKEWIEPKKLVSYIPYEPNSANYLQVELQGSNGFSAIEVEGRSLKYENDAWVSSPWKRLLLNKPVANQVNELNRTSLPSRNFFYFPQEELSFITSKTFQEDNKTRQDALAMNQSAGKVSMGNKDTWTNKGTGEHKSNPVTADGTHWDYNNTNWKPLSGLGISSIDFDTKGNFYAEDTITITSNDTFTDILNKNSFIYETQPLIPLGFKSSKPYHISSIPIIGKIVSKFWGDKTINPHTTQRKPISIGYFMDCDIAGMLANIYSAEENDIVYAPLSSIVGDENRASKYLGTTALNTTLCFSLTDKVQEGANTYDTIYFGQTKNEFGQNILSNGAPYLFGRPNQVRLDKDPNSVFVIDSITIYGLHKGKVKLTAFSDLSSSIWTTTIQSKANWTNSIRDWATTISTGGWAEQYCDWSILDFSWPDRPDKLSTNDIAIDYKNSRNLDFFYPTGAPHFLKYIGVYNANGNEWKNGFSGYSTYDNNQGAKFTIPAVTTTVTKTYEELGLENKADFKKKYKQMIIPIAGKISLENIGEVEVPARTTLSLDIGDADTYSIDRIALQLGEQVIGETTPVIAKNDSEKLKNSFSGYLNTGGHNPSYYYANSGGFSIKLNITISLTDTGITIVVTENEYACNWGNKWGDRFIGIFRQGTGITGIAKNKNENKLIEQLSIPKLTLVPRPVTTEMKIEGGSTQLEMQSGYAGQDDNVWTIYTRESETAEWVASSGVFTLSGEPEGVSISQETTEGVTTARVVWDDQQQAGTYTIKVQAAKEVGEKLLEVEKEVKLYCEEPAPYTITTNVTNGTYTGPTTIAKIGGTANITITPDAGYSLPTSVTVTNATYTYDSTTGVISLSNPTDNVTITAACRLPSWSGLRFSANGETTISLSITGTLTNAVDIWVRKASDTSWTQWFNGTSGSSSTLTLKNGQQLFVWNKNNTLSESSACVSFVITGYVPVYAMGNCNSMINFSDLSYNCFLHLFQNCTALETAPELPSTILLSGCYTEMFIGCTSLKVPPKIPTDYVPHDRCLQGMFADCSSLHVNEDSGGVLFFTASSVSDPLRYCGLMFLNTGGTITGEGTPTKGKSYYYD